MTDHYVHHLQVSMPLSIAETITDTALAAGRDAGGNLILLKREDGSGILRDRQSLGRPRHGDLEPHHP